MSYNPKKETIYLYLVQISNMVVPLLVIPYLTSVFGVEYYGKLSYAQVVSLIALFLLISVLIIQPLKKLVLIENQQLQSIKYTLMYSASKQPFIFLLFLLFSL